MPVGRAPGFWTGSPGRLAAPDRWAEARDRAPDWGYGAFRGDTASARVVATGAASVIVAAAPGAFGVVRTTMRPLSGLPAERLYACRSPSEWREIEMFRVAPRDTSPAPTRSHVAPEAGAGA